MNQDGHDPYLETITIEAKKTVTHDIRLIAANYETVSATVVDESGAPVKNAVVTLTESFLITLLQMKTENLQ